MSTRSRRRQGKPEILGGSFALGTALSGAPPAQIPGILCARDRPFRAPPRTVTFGKGVNTGTRKTSTRNQLA